MKEMCLYEDIQAQYEACDGGSFTHERSFF